MKKLDNFSNCLAILATADFKLAETNVYTELVSGQFNLTLNLLGKHFRKFEKYMVLTALLQALLVKFCSLDIKQDF